jgi:ATP-binding cassette subfamily F protein 3
VIRLESVSKAYGPKVILKEATFHFPEGERVALVGANGAGKTTLLNILCQLEEPDGGGLVRPKECIIGYLPQEPNPHPLSSVLEECVSGHLRIQELRNARELAQKRLIEDGDFTSLAQFERAQAQFEEAGGLALESRARGILVGLGFQSHLLDFDPKTLSGGWRMRLELAKVFLNDPDFLVLDEPTNHLDLPSLVWVENYLRQFSGCLVFVSHDRGLLNRLATITLHLSKGRLNVYKGNFDAFLEQKEAIEQQDLARAAALARRKSELSRFVERFGAKASKAKQAQARVKMIARLQDLEDELDVPQRESEVGFVFAHPTPSGRDVYQLENLSIGYRPDSALASQINLSVLRGQRICIIGSNGIGKSTLLQTLAGVIPPLSGLAKQGHNVEMAYFAQDQLSVLDAERSALLNVLDATHLSEREARAVLGQFLFHGDDVHKPVKVLSGGEKNRVGLAILLSRKANLMILDEPTNHLDMATANMLAEALDGYEGTLLCVSHDREFINAFATHIFVMLPGGEHDLFEGNLEDYPRLASARGFPDILSQNVHVIRSDVTQNSAVEKDVRIQKRSDALAQKRERQKLTKRTSELEALMSTLHARIKSLDEELDACGSEYLRAQSLAEQRVHCQTELEKVEVEWLSVQEALEQMMLEEL